MSETRDSMIAQLKKLVSLPSEKTGSGFGMTTRYTFEETARAVISYITGEAESFWAEYETRSYQDGMINSESLRSSM